MTAPVTADDLIQGAVKWLSPRVADVLSAYPDGNPWLFQHSLWVMVEGSGGTAAVLSQVGGWAGPNTYNTLSFPRLSVEIYTDPIRDPARNVVEPGEVYRRISAAFAVFDRHLHRPDSGDQWWGTVRTITASRLAEPLIYPVPDTDGLLRLQVFYALTVG